MTSSHSTKSIRLNYMGYPINTRGVANLYRDAFKIGNALGESNLTPELQFQLGAGIMDLEFQSPEDAIMAKLIISSLDIVGKIQTPS